jgi:hypothetical protein
MSLLHMNKRNILEVLDNTPWKYAAIETDVHYIYFSYPLDFTQLLRVALHNCTVEHTHKLVCVGLLDLERQQPHLSSCAAYTTLLAGVYNGLSIITDNTAIIEIEPVPFQHYGGCSGIHVTELTNPELADGQWAAQVEIYSSDTIIFSDSPCWAVTKT